MDSPLDFFQQKKDWSKYKDLILDYYLKPYLNKVALLRQPIAVVDCFAGPGRFDDGEIGSPLIILENLRLLHQRGVDVSAVYIEKNPELFQRLSENVSGADVPTKTLLGSFRDHVAQISALARDHTVFIYVDPIKPKQLLFDDLKGVYDQLQTGQSVETLINFMSKGFFRGVRGSKDRMLVDGVIQKDYPLVVNWNEIAGGEYWQKVVFDESLSTSERIDRLAGNYAEKLGQWFRWVLVYAIREKYENRWPKYHLIFGSRSNDGVDLMNRAMVKARREFVGARFVEGMLFDNQPAEEVVDPQKVQEAVIAVARTQGKTTWEILRAYATISNPSMYTDSEFNRAIKQAIQNGRLGSDCSGTKVEEKASVWLNPDCR